MSTDSTKTPDLELRATSGPAPVSFHLGATDTVVVGRRSTSTLQLNDPAVSRDHAAFTFRGEPGAGGTWVFDDRGSTHGTWLNGVRLRAGRQYHIRPGDLIAIGPWTLLVVDRAGGPKAETTLATVDDIDAPKTFVSPHEPDTGHGLSEQALRLLEQCLQRVHAAADMADVATAGLEVLLEGTSFGEAAFVRLAGDDESIELVASCGRDNESGSPPRFSRALIKAASSGGPACLQRGSPAGALDVRRVTSDVLALCLPIMATSTLVGFIYLEAPSPAAAGESGSSIDGFPLAVAKLTAMGIANLMRIDIERRQERLDAEIQAATETQQWLLPVRRGQVGSFRYTAETRRGRYIGGDFLDVIPLGDRLAIVLGDVGGKGVPVSVLVGAAHGFLHASLLAHGDPARAVQDVDSFFQTRTAHGSFLKLWVGVFDGATRGLTYLSAGHDSAMIAHPDGRFDMLDVGRSRAVGAEGTAFGEAATVALSPGARTLVLSDGFISQRACAQADDSGDDESTPADERSGFGILRVQECAQSLRSGDDEVGALFAALVAHAGTPDLDDDASVVLVRA